MANAWNKLHLTSSTVVAPTPAGTAGVTSPGQMTLHAINFNTVAAMAVVTLFDWNSTTTPQNLIASYTFSSSSLVPITMDYDAIFTVGITIIIATAAADLTVMWV